MDKKLSRKERRAARRAKREARRAAFKALTDRDLVALALAKGGKLTAGYLSSATELTNPQAWWKLTQVVNKGIFKQEYDNATLSTLFILKHPELYQDVEPAHASAPVVSQNPPSLTDAQVIAAAVKAGGKITPGMLCMAADISITAAKEKLQNLQHNGVFGIDATEEGGLVYILQDLASYQVLLPKDEETDEPSGA